MLVDDGLIVATETENIEDRAQKVLVSGPNCTNYSKGQVIELFFRQIQTFALIKCNDLCSALAKETTPLPVNYSYNFVILDDDSRGWKIVMRKYQRCPHRGIHHIPSLRQCVMTLLTLP